MKKLFKTIIVLIFLFFAIPYGCSKLSTQNPLTPEQIAQQKAEYEQQEAMISEHADRLKIICGGVTDTAFEGMIDIGVFTRIQAMSNCQDTEYYHSNGKDILAFPAAVKYVRSKAFK